MLCVWIRLFNKVRCSNPLAPTTFDGLSPKYVCILHSDNFKVYLLIILVTILERGECVCACFCVLCVWGAGGGSFNFETILGDSGTVLLQYRSLLSSIVLTIIVKCRHLVFSVIYCRYVVFHFSRYTWG